VDLSRQANFRKYIGSRVQFITALGSKHANLELLPSDTFHKRSEVYVR
jgi:hypothetical protein